MIGKLKSAGTNKCNLPKGWGWSTLGEISEKPQYGWTTKANPEKGQLRLLRTTDITSGTIDWSSVPFCTEEPDDVDKYLVKSGDILVSRAGSIGVSYLLDNPKRAVFASYLIRFRPKESVNKKYVYYYLKSPDYWEAIGASKVGIAVPNVNASKLSQVSVPIAPPDQQLLIVSEIEKQFSRLDEAVAGLKRIKINLKRYRAAVLKAAVEGKLTEEWRKTHPKIETGAALLKSILTERKKKWEEKNPGKKYKEPVAPDTSNLPELPKGWGWANLDSVCHQIGDVDHKMPKAKDKGVPYISTKDFLPAGDIDYENAKKIDQVDYVKLSRKIFPDKGDILLSRYGTVGEVRLVKTKTLFQASYSIAILKPVTGSMSDYLSLALQTEPIQGQIKKYTRATAQPDLGLAHIRQLCVPLAPIEEQKKIIEGIDRLFSVAEEIDTLVETNLKRAERLRQSILYCAFRGDLNIEKMKLAQEGVL